MRSPATPIVGLLFSDQDADLHDRRWRLDRDGYAKRSISVNGKPTFLLAHHEVCIRAFGRRPDWSKREVCDHINRDKLDNRRENIRIVHTSENNRNKQISRPSFRKDLNKWRASSQFNKKSHHLGVYANCEEAQDAINQFCLSMGRSVKP